MKNFVQTSKWHLHGKFCVVEVLHCSKAIWWQQIWFRSKPQKLHLKKQWSAVECTHDNNDNGIMSNDPKSIIRWILLSRFNWEYISSDYSINVPSILFFLIGIWCSLIFSLNELSWWFKDMFPIFNSVNKHELR